MTISAWRSGLLLAFLLVAAPLPGGALQAQELDWVRSAGGPRWDQGRGIATDPSGNIYVVGEFVVRATFGAGEANETELRTANWSAARFLGPKDPFIAKYAADGTLVWARSAVGTDDDEGDEVGLSVAADHRGNSHVTGFFHETVTFGLGQANETALSAVGGHDVFVAKYAPDGNLLWAKSAGGTHLTRGNSIATDHSGNSYVTGSALGTVRFGVGEVNETPLSAGSFVAKYARNGALLWARSAGGGTTANGIALDHRGNSYVTGSFSGTAIFGVGEANETILSVASGSGAFVAKYAPDGILLWAKSAERSGHGIATDVHGNSYVTGLFSGTATFGMGEADETILSVVSGLGVFVAKYAPDGILLWATSAGGWGHGIATDVRGNSYVTGWFSGTTTFGMGEANETMLSSWPSPTGLFVAKYARDGALLWAIGQGSIKVGDNHGNAGNGIATDQRGNAYVTGRIDGTATFGAGEANETVISTGSFPDVFVAKYRSPPGR
jgi:hypothetical protein